MGHRIDNDRMIELSLQIRDFLAKRGTSTFKQIKFEVGELSNDRLLEILDRIMLEGHVFRTVAKNGVTLYHHKNTKLYETG